MKKVIIIIVMLALVFSFSFSFSFGCGKPPTAELNQAKQALVEAEKAGAAEYVADKYQQAQTEIDRAEEQIATKSYDVALKNIQTAMTIAKEATQLASLKKEEVKREAEQMMPEVEGLVKEMKTAAGKVPKSDKEKKELVEGGLAQNIEEFNASQAALKEGKYLEAKTKASSAKKGLLGLEAFIQGR